MSWKSLYSQSNKPDISNISSYVNCSLWNDLCLYIEDAYKVTPSIEYSRCSMETGWNVKYKKSGRSLCTLYPKENSFTCLISIGTKETIETELLIPSFDIYLQELYKNTKPFNGSRWLMINITSKEILDGVKALINIRVKPKVLF
ncbi:MAG: DUF3788 domain-containing protein [Clostridia bacterium]